jgi:hypothetical protein
MSSTGSRAGGASTVPRSLNDKVPVWHSGYLPPGSAIPVVMFSNHPFKPWLTDEFSVRIRKVDGLWTFYCPCCGEWGQRLSYQTMCINVGSHIDIHHPVGSTRAPGNHSDAAYCPHSDNHAHVAGWDILDPFECIHCGKALDEPTEENDADKA